jgi:hypothetical protein
MTTADDAPSSGPLCGEAEFADLIEGMVTERAPQLFAVVQELGDRVDGWIAAWGMAFEDRVEVIGADGGVRLSVGTAERALVGFARCPDITAHVIWFNPDARAAGRRP